MTERDNDHVSIGSAPVEAYNRCPSTGRRHADMTKERLEIKRRNDRDAQSRKRQRAKETAQRLKELEATLPPLSRKLELEIAKARRLEKKLQTLLSVVCPRLINDRDTAVKTEVSDAERRVEVNQTISSWPTPRAVSAIRYYTMLATSLTPSIDRLK